MKQLLTYAGMNSDRQLCSQDNTVFLSPPEEQNKQHYAETVTKTQN